MAENGPNLVRIGASSVDICSPLFDIGPNLANRAAKQADLEAVVAELTSTLVEPSPNSVETSPALLVATSSWVDVGPGSINLGPMLINSASILVSRNKGVSRHSGLICTMVIIRCGLRRWGRTQASRRQGPVVSAHHAESMDELVGGRGHFDDESKCDASMPDDCVRHDLYSGRYIAIDLLIKSHAYKQESLDSRSHSRFICEQGLRGKPKQTERYRH